MAEKRARPNESPDKPGRSLQGKHGLLKREIEQFYEGIADPTRRLVIAVYEGDVAQALDAIDGGADINALHSSTHIPVIHLAAGGGHKAIVEKLIETGKCDLTVRDPMGRLPSDCAAYSAFDLGLAESLAEEEGRQFREKGKDPRIPASGK